MNGLVDSGFIVLGGVGRRRTHDARVGSVERDAPVVDAVDAWTARLNGRKRT
jgi:hypothetical protein